MGCKVTHPTGFIVHKDYPFLAATPDGIISDDLILEVKYPKVAEKQSLVLLAKGEGRLDRTGQDRVRHRVLGSKNRKNKTALPRMSSTRNCRSTEMSEHGNQR